MTNSSSYWMRLSEAKNKRAGVKECRRCMNITHICNTIAPLELLPWIIAIGISNASLLFYLFIILWVSSDTSIHHLYWSGRHHFWMVPSFDKGNQRITPVVWSDYAHFDGIEPSTFGLRVRCSTCWAKGACGGICWNRTSDAMLFMHALYQLS